MQEEGQIQEDVWGQIQEVQEMIKEIEDSLQEEVVQERRMPVQERRMPVSDRVRWVMCCQDRWVKKGSGSCGQAG